MSALRAFGRFWYDFIIGDDWKIAAAVVIVLAVVGTLVATTTLSDEALTFLGGVLVLSAFTVIMLFDVRRDPRK